MVVNEKIFLQIIFIRNVNFSLSKKYENNFKKNTLAGYVITCFGDEGSFHIFNQVSKYSLSDKMVFKTFKI